MAPEVPTGKDQAQSNKSSESNKLNLLDLNAPGHRHNDVSVPSAASAEPASVLDFTRPIYPSHKVDAVKPVPGEQSKHSDKPCSPSLHGEKGAIVLSASDPATEQQPPQTPDQIRRSQLTEEAAFTDRTKKALLHDASEFKPVINDDGSTTYTLVQLGMSNRAPSQDRSKVDYYKRKVEITVPEGAQSLKDCKFDFQDRQVLEQDQYTDLLAKDQKRQIASAQSKEVQTKSTRPKEIGQFAHGIRTSADDADFEALMLQLTQGRTIVDVDWACASDGETSLSKGYEKDCRAAKDSSDSFQKALDTTISQIGASNTDMIGFSQGASFDLRYLEHRRDIKADPVNSLILTHPDIKDTELTQEIAGGTKPLFPSVAREAFVVGSASDEALLGAQWHSAMNGDLTKLQSMFSAKFKEDFSNGERLGNGSQRSRQLATDCGAAYIEEEIPPGKEETICHFVNFDAIARLLNAPSSESTDIAKAYSSARDPILTASK